MVRPSARTPPLLRPLRLLRVLALIRILDRTASESFAGRATEYAVGTALFAVMLGALAALEAERAVPSANITNFGDALWWATTTVTAVGYGDHYPVTLEGRFVAVALMVVGIGRVGTVTASIASWLVDRSATEKAMAGNPEGSGRTR